MLLLILYLLLAVVVSFLCSIMEAVLLSTPSSHILVALESDKPQPWAEKFNHFKKDIDRPLSAILSLNTVAHTIGAAGVGAQAVAVFGEAYFGIISAILTIIILLFTEIIPKTLGAIYWKSLGKIAVMLIQFTIWITYPLVLVSSVITKILSGGKQEKTTSREEISVLTSIAAKEGIFNPEEHKILQSVLRLKSVVASEIMTPRTVVSCADAETTVTQFAKNKEHYNFSRIPIFENLKDNVVGYVVKHRIYETLADDKPNVTLANIKRDIAVVGERTPVFELWNILLKRKEHIALIVDEYGGWSGIATMEDIIETILGFEIIDERDKITNMRAYAKQRWEARKQMNEQREKFG